jgi:hypothetical protein
LDIGNAQPLKQDNNDVAIFVDALKGIEAIRKIGFSVEGIIAVNKSFDTPNEEQPTLPGHLRNAFYNPDDAISVIVSADGRTAYFPKDVITREDLQIIVGEFETSEKTEKDAWRIFARLSKLQAFQDGNKRTALICANAAIGSFENEDYLLLPINDLDRMEFTLSLMRFYLATTTQDEEKAFRRMMNMLPSDFERRNYLEKEETANEPTENEELKTRKIKLEFREKK